MRIVIKYDSCWQTSFLDGDPNITISKKANPRKFVATSSTRGETATPISDSTVLGILSRLIGDQRKLYQSRHSENYYFSDIENKVNWRILEAQTVNELAYLTNKSDDRCSQGNWLGVLLDDNPWFFSENSPLFWSVLYLKRDEILDFINCNVAHKPVSMDEIDCRPTALLEKLAKITDIKSEFGSPWKTSERIRKEIKGEIQKVQDKKESYIEKNEGKSRKTEKQQSVYREKLEEFDNEISHLKKDFDDVANNSENLRLDEQINQCISLLEKRYPDCEFWNDGQIYPQRIYTSALYEQASRLICGGISLPFVLEKKGKAKGEISIKGFAKNSKAHRGFNGARDWLNPMSGGRKKAVGTPCHIQKQSGQLEITIDVDRDKGKELEQMIENAGVSSFYLGKKGLAYVSKIRV